MKRIITVTVFILFLLSVAVFMLFGPQIRAALSPEVRYIYPDMQDADGRFYNAVPASAVWEGEDGGTYVWRVDRSDAFPEPAFVVTAWPIQIEAEQDGMVLVSLGALSSSDAVAVEWEAELKDGMCVKPGR
jgi:uncharacterized protein YyaL (SSP411 family)